MHIQVYIVFYFLQLAYYYYYIYITILYISLSVLKVLCLKKCGIIDMSCSIVILVISIELYLLQITSWSSSGPSCWHSVLLAWAR